jgi:hypothetical protein
LADLAAIVESSNSNAAIRTINDIDAFWERKSSGDDIGRVVYSIENRS